MLIEKGAYHQRTKEINLFSFVTILVLTVIIAIVVKIIFAQTQPQTISPLPDPTGKSGTFSLFFTKETKDPTLLLTQIKKIIDQQPGNYSVYVLDLINNQAFGINESVILTAASVNKIPILATLYKDAAAGTIDLNEIITLQPNDIQYYGTGILQGEGPGGEYSLKSLAQLMIKKSDNTAAFVLMQKLGATKVQGTVNNLGLTQTNIEENLTSNKDMALLFQKIYSGQIVTKTNTRALLEMMSNSDFENRLPALLPKNVKVYHKIGTEVGFVHDVGIVETIGHPYYIGVMTSDISGEEQAETTIGQISLLVPK